MAVTTDPIADLLTRIRNANRANHDQVEMPASKLKAEICRILQEEGYIKGYDVHRVGIHDVLRVQLKFAGPRKEKCITQLQRVSRPGLRIYKGKDELPRVLGNLGIAIISTSRGVMTDREARRRGLGGEVLCYVW
ncbi:MAG: 30S ribosomal protein S8 [Armatimonadota bacterium]|jgi:small subunit ribosomal protein S8|nr:30S ribosomal protein S8 [Armatimonadota bacterium]